MTDQAGTRIIILGLLALAVLAIILAVLMNVLDGRGLLEPSELNPAFSLSDSSASQSEIDTKELLASIAAIEHSAQGIVVLSMGESTTITRLEEIAASDAHYVQLITHASGQELTYLEMVERDGKIWQRTTANGAWDERADGLVTWPTACFETDNFNQELIFGPCLSGVATLQGTALHDNTEMTQYTLIGTGDMLPNLQGDADDTIQVDLWFPLNSSLPESITWEDTTLGDTVWVYGELELSYVVDETLIPIPLK